MAHLFDKDKSTTFKDWVRPENVRIQFGSGAIYGRFVKDNIYLGDPGSSQIALEQMDFGLATKAPINGAMFDALVGLAYPQFAHEGVIPFFDEIMKKKYLQKNIFSFYLSQNIEETSELLFGDINQERFEG